MSKPTLPPYDDQPPPYTPYPTQPPAVPQAAPYPPAVPRDFPNAYQPSRTYAYSYLDSPMSECSSTSGSYDRSPEGHRYGYNHFDSRDLTPTEANQPVYKQTIILKERRKDSDAENSCLLTLLFAMCCCCLCVD